MIYRISRGARSLPRLALFAALALTLAVALTAGLRPAASRQEAAAPRALSIPTATPAASAVALAPGPSAPPPAPSPTLTITPSPTATAQPAAAVLSAQELRTANLEEHSARGQSLMEALAGLRERQRQEAQAARAAAEQTARAKAAQESALRSAAVAPTATLPATPAPPPAPAAGSRFERLALANYFVWYDGGNWGGCNIANGDQPVQPYSSDDPNALARHLRMALDSGLDGFTVQWYAPGERTDRNVAALLDKSQGANFRSAVVFARHFWPGSPAPSQQNVAESLRYVADRYGKHNNYLRLDGKPVIIFADMERVPLAAGQTPQQAWAAIRNLADPHRQMWWIAEGLDASYLDTFDGLFVYKFSHAAYPNDYVKASRWAANARAWEGRTGLPKLWMATISPGWDDRRAGCRPDVRVPSAPHRVERAGGAFYRATFESALASNPDWLWINSFNEWVEGTYIEPGAQYGDTYMQITRELIQRFKQQQ